MERGFLSLAFIKGRINMMLKMMREVNDVLQTMIIHENGSVSYRGFLCYEALLAYRERNRRDRVIILEGVME